MKNFGNTKGKGKSEYDQRILSVSISWLWYCTIAAQNTAIGKTG